MIEYIVASLAAAGAFAASSVQLRRRLLKAQLLRALSKITSRSSTVSLEIMEDGTLVFSGHGVVRVSRFIIVEEPAVSPRRLGDQELGRLARKFASTVYSTDTDTMIAVIRTPIDARRMMRSLEKKILNMRLTLEYNPEDKGLERKLQVLETMHARIVSGEKPSRSLILIGIRIKGQDREALAKQVRAEAEAMLSTLSSLGLKARMASRDDVYSALTAITGILDADARTTVLENDLAFVGPGLMNREPSGRGVYIGRDIETRAPFFYDLERYGTRHIVVVGPTGRGKTTLLRVLTARSIAVYDGLKALVLDFKGDLVPRLAGLMPVIEAREVSLPELSTMPPGYPPGAWAYLVLESIKTTLELSSEEEHTMYSAVLSSLSSKGRVDREALEQAAIREPSLSAKLRYLYSRDYIGGAGLAPIHAGYDLGGIPGDEKNAYASLLLARLIADIEATGLSERITRLVVIDEAWRLMRGGGRIVKRLVKEARSYGVSVVLATQNLEDLPPEILDNAGTFIAFGSPADEYLDKVARYASLSRLEAEKLKWFATGDALIRLYDDPRPFWVHVDPVA